RQPSMADRLNWERSRKEVLAATRGTTPSWSDMGPVAETHVSLNGRRDSAKGRRQLLARYRRLPLAKRRRQADAFRAELSRLSPSDDAAARHWRKDFQPLLQETTTDSEAGRERLAEEARRLREASVAARER